MCCAFWCLGQNGNELCTGLDPEGLNPFGLGPFQTETFSLDPTIGASGNFFKVPKASEIPLPPHTHAPFALCTQRHISFPPLIPHLPGAFSTVPGAGGASKSLLLSPAGLCRGWAELGQQQWWWARGFPLPVPASGGTRQAIGTHSPTHHCCPRPRYAQTLHSWDAVGWSCSEVFPAPGQQRKLQQAWGKEGDIFSCFEDFKKSLESSAVWSPCWGEGAGTAGTATSAPEVLLLHLSLPNSESALGFVQYWISSFPYSYSPMISIHLS